MKLKLYKLMPKHGWILFTACFCFNMLVYYGADLLALRAPITPALPLDGCIPLRTEWIIVYVLSYLQWVLCYVLAARERRDVSLRILGGEMIGKCICLIVFILLPTTMQRPEITGTAPWDALTRLIYSIDAPTRLFPSIHCFESYVCFRSALLSEHLPRRFAVGMGIFSTMVFASVVLIKQHLVLDIVAGIIVGELGLQLSRLLPRLFAKEPLYEKE